MTDKRDCFAGGKDAAFPRDMFTWLYGPILAPKADRLGTYAGALAYSFVLSLIPFLVVTFTLATELTPKKDLQTWVNAYSDLLLDILPGQTVAIATHTPGAKGGMPDLTVEAQHRRGLQVASLSVKIIGILQNRSRGFTTIGFVLAVITSFNLMTQIVRTLLFIFDDHRRPLEWSGTLLLKTVALFAIWTLLLLVFSACSLMMPVITAMLREAHLNPSFWNAPLLWASYLGGLGLLFCAFFLTYLLVPTKRYRLSRIRDGSLVTALGWALCGYLFSKVLPSMWNTNAVYEALGSIVIILLWAQACAWTVIIGACWVVRFPGKR